MVNGITMTSFKKLSVIIPAHNEARTIRAIIEQVLRAPLPDLEREILVVDDESTDGTGDEVRSIPGVGLYRTNGRRGKGSAVKTGIRHALGDLVLIQDADLEYDPRDYAVMLAPILAGRTEVTLGVRRRSGPDGHPMYWLGRIGNSLITWTTNVLYRNNAREYEGGYKAFTKRLLDRVEVHADGFDFDNELVCKILKLGYRTVDVPISYHPRSYEDGKKIRWRDGIRILWTIVRCRFAS